MEYFKALVGELRNNPMATFCALMVATIVYLVMFIAAQQKRMDDLQTAYRVEMNATERRCAQEIDQIRKEQFAELRAASERQAEIERQIRKIKQR